ncbi:MAG: NAD(P)/FAD-dependent oxidoreductase [Clostridia bacterium]|nr:NAD(P)/FAD-dependent oxidoreductase [Clostridia bacterium]MBR5044742.1 NAD(P)/FAD-dependent oxidoreductase [Clostridia bacterium]
MKRYLIIGNGIAAVGCIEGIRALDTDGEITVISEEKHPVYGRPLISYYLEGKTTLDKMNYRPADFYEKNGCRLIYGRAVALDPKKTATLDDGTALPYDELCVATGSRPFVPPFEGLDAVEKKFSFMTLDDALALEKALDKDARVLIVGAGLIGLKCAEGIKARVGRVTVCDLADRVLSSILDAECAAVVQKHLEANGISFLLGDTAVKFNHNKAQMKSGKTVDFDLLVLAVGVRANTDLVKGAGGMVNRGIVVDQKMQTSIPGVYAAGDCAEGFDASVGGNRVIAILPNAYMQGHTAGINMAGGDASQNDAIPMNSIGFFGLHMMTAGAYVGKMAEEKTERGVKRFFTENGLLKGFILIGETERAGIYTSLIREKAPLDTVDFELTKKVASNLIFSQEKRRNKFGSVV